MISVYSLKLSFNRWAEARPFIWYQNYWYSPRNKDFISSGGLECGIYWREASRTRKSLAFLHSSSSHDFAFKLIHHSFYGVSLMELRLKLAYTFPEMLEHILAIKTCVLVASTPWVKYFYFSFDLPTFSEKMAAHRGACAVRSLL